MSLGIAMRVICCFIEFVDDSGRLMVWYKHGWATL